MSEAEKENRLFTKQNAGAVNQKLVRIEGFSGFCENAPVYAEPE
jgi:hypothetical protein